jgi:hypothetical protein
MKSGPRKHEKQAYWDRQVEVESKTHKHRHLLGDMPAYPNLLKIYGNFEFVLRAQKYWKGSIMALGDSQ